MPTKKQDKVEDDIRLSLVSSHTSRNLDGSGTSTVKSSIVGLGAVGSFIVGATTYIKDKKFINCFADKIVDPLTREDTYYVTKRPGFAVLNTPEVGSVATAVKVWSVNADKVISAFGSTNSNLYDGVTLLGAVTGQVVSIDETLIGTTAYLVVPTTSNKAYYSTGTTFTEITDTAFPSNASRTITGNFVFIDGYAFIMDTGGRIYNSDLNSITAWTEDSYISANMYPDTGIGLARYKNMIVAFSKETVEFFYNSGETPGSPLSRYESGFVHFGCLNQYSYTQIEDTVAWISSSDRSGLSVYLLEGVQPKKISTAYIDSQLAQATTASTFMTAARLVGKTFIVITSSAGTFVYCVEDNMWHEWLSQVPLWHHMSGTTSGSRVIYSVSRSDTGGKVFSIDPATLVYTDNGVEFLMLLQTTKFDNNTIKFKFLNKLSLVGDTASATNSMSISWSDNDYVTFSTPRTIDLNSNNPYLMNCGKFRRRAFRFNNVTANPVRLEAIELQIKQGIH